MIRSMTGFGRAQCRWPHRHVTVELKSVNHRYFEFSSRVPREYSFLDEKLKTYLQGKVSRGKVEAYVFIEATDAADTGVSVNFSLAQGYYDALRALQDKLDLHEPLTAAGIARMPDVLTVTGHEIDENEVWDDVRQTADEALERFIAMREREGARMREDVLARRDAILHDVAQVEERSPQTVKEHMDKVMARMKELLDGAAVDETRLLTEAGLYADKIAVAEETVRLRSHMDQLTHMMDSEEPVGRKLDFLIQETNREANTIGSKCNDLTLSSLVVDLKSEIEKIREQIQNIE